MIQFNSLISEFNLENQLLLKEWLISVINKEGKKVGDLNFIFCSDSYLLKINKEYLHHNYYTDIITFPSSDQSSIISGEVFISIDRVKDNANSDKNKFEIELYRVLVHGILHLIGYNDHTLEEITLMRTKEDNYLLLLPEF